MARLGVLFGPLNLDSDSAGLIFVIFFEITTSSYRFVKLHVFNDFVHKSIFANFFACYYLSLIIAQVQWCSCHPLCSYKKGVLNFLDQLCLLYEREFQQLSSYTGDTKKEFLETAVELANTHNLPSEIYKSLLKEVSVVDVRNHLNKVFLLCFISLNFEICSHG